MGSKNRRCAMQFFPRSTKKRGNIVSGTVRRAKEEEFLLEREKGLQEDLKTTADKVETLRTEVKKWYEDNENNLLPRKITAEYPVDSR